MNSKRSTQEPDHPSKNPQRLGVILATFLLAACGSDADSTADGNSAGKGNGNIQASQLTIMRKADSETTPDVRKMDIASISCRAEGESPRTRVEFEGGGFAQARMQMNESWVIAVGLPELEFALRDLIMPRLNPDLVFDSSGNITGPRTFRAEVNSDDPVTYEIIFKIVC